MGLGRFFEFEASRNLRLDDALRPKFEQLFAPAADAVRLAPEMAQVDTEDALVGIDERHRIELKPGRAGKHSQHVEKAALLPCHRRGNSKHAEPPRRCKQAKPLLERLPSNWIKNELNAAAIGDLARPCLEILRAIVYQVLDAKRAQLRMFGCRCRANDAGANVSCDLRCCNANSAARRMDENRLAPIQSTHDNDELPRREIIDWNCCSFQSGHTRRAGEDLLHWHANDIRIAAEA